MCVCVLYVYRRHFGFVSLHTTMAMMASKRNTNRHMKDGDRASKRARARASERAREFCRVSPKCIRAKSAYSRAACVCVCVCV